MDIDHFWDYVDKMPGYGPSGDCWIWKGMIQLGKRGGYGHLVVNGKIKKSHRISWELQHGRIPDGLQVLHRCDIRACVNPNHLFLGTNKDNVDDKIAKGRHLRGEEASRYSNPKRGEEQANAKFSDEKVLEMRKLYQSGLSIKEIATMIGERQNVVNMIVHGRRWAHLPGSIPPRKRAARNFSDKIFKLKNSGMSQREISKLLKFSEAAISRVIKG